METYKMNSLLLDKGEIEKSGGYFLIQNILVVLCKRVCIISLNQSQLDLFY